MGVYEKVIKQKKSFAIWGCGDYLYNVIDKIDPQLNISCVCDSDKNKWGTTIAFGDREITCVSPDTFYKKKHDAAMIAIQSVQVFENIKKNLEELHIEVCHINDAIRAYRPIYERQAIDSYDRVMESIKEPGDDDKIKCFISISVPIDFCNLQCEYCYVGQHRDFYKKEVVYYSPEFIRRALSRKRIGGTAFINLCGTGETLLCKELPDIIKELLYEGHYISIITNALVDQSIVKLLSFNKNEKLFFKCSFHYLELKRKKLLDRFVKNVHLIRESGASFSIEIVPHDELIPYIKEIKDFCIKNFGALPHITVARDETLRELPILSEMSEKEYIDTWGVFESPMFDFKMKTRKKQTKYCVAGRGTFLMMLDHGGTRYCPGNDRYINVYSNIEKVLSLSEIGERCKSPYCINAHAYLTLGMVEDIDECSYLAMRDRLCEDGSHWVQEKMSNIMGQRICDNIRE